MDNQVTASVLSGYDVEKGRYIQVEFLARCGCRWVVDMWGNVRSVAVCSQCMDIADPLERQMDLKLGEAMARASIKSS